MKFADAERPCARQDVRTREHLERRETPMWRANESLEFPREPKLDRRAACHISFEDADERRVLGGKELLDGTQDVPSVAPKKSPKCGEVTFLRCG